MTEEQLIQYMRDNLEHIPWNLVTTSRPSQFTANMTRFSIYLSAESCAVSFSEGGGRTDLSSPKLSALYSEVEAYVKKCNEEKTTKFLKEFGDALTEMVDRRKTNASA